MSSGLDPGRLATLDVLLERLLPGAAVEAGVRRYIERALAEGPAGDRDAYANGLAALEARAFATLPPDRQDEVVASLEPDSFLELVRRHLLEGMFGDPRWGGNVGARGWELLGYDGPRLVWAADDQRIEASR